MTISVLRPSAGLWDSIWSGLAVSGQVHLELFSVWKSGTSDLCCFQVNLLLGLVVRKVP